MRGESWRAQKEQNRRGWSFDPCGFLPQCLGRDCDFDWLLEGDDEDDLTVFILASMPKKTHNFPPQLAPRVPMRATSTK